MSKGSRQRPGDKESFDKNYDLIFRKDRKPEEFTKPGKRVVYPKGSMKYAWYNFLARQRQTGIAVEMTFTEFKDWWDATGKWDQRGRSAEDYCMSRIKQYKGYSLDNVICIKIKDRKYGRI